MTKEQGIKAYDKHGRIIYSIVRGRVNYIVNRRHWCDTACGQTAMKDRFFGNQRIYGFKTLEMTEQYIKTKASKYKLTLKDK